MHVAVITIGDGTTASLRGKGGNCDHAQHAYSGHRHVQSPREIRHLAGPECEYVHRVAAAESLRPDSAAIGQLKQERVVWVRGVRVSGTIVW